MSDSEKQGSVNHYDAQYGSFATDLLADIRREAFGSDIGQTGWLTADEQDRFIEWLGLDPDSHLLDIACGSGRPTLRIAEKSGCRVSGIDLHEDAVGNARRFARELGLGDRADFCAGDAANALPYASESFDALVCIDAVNHLADRPVVFAEWHRVLRPGGRLLFTDPIVVTGPLTNEEIAIRASIGFFLFVPLGTDERLLAQAGFSVEHVEDRTANMARNARGWLEARQRRETDLRGMEGDKTFDGQQLFFETAARLAEEKRLSRFAFLARKDG